MAAPLAVSGNLGKVLVGGSTVAEILSWKFNLDRGLKTYGAQSGVLSGTGWLKTLLGTHGLSGSFDGYFDPNYPIGSVVDVDTLVTLTLYLVLPGVSSPVSYVTGSARISTRDQSADINTGDAENFTYNFQFHGPPTFNNV